MKVDNNTQFIESIDCNGQLINIYIDDAGQSYLLEYVDRDGDLQVTSCGSYNTNYKWCIEELFGDPAKNCSNYLLQKSKNCLCDSKYTHGYCNKCMYADFYIWWKKHLMELSVIDPRLQLQNEHLRELFAHIFEANFPEYFTQLKSEEVNDGNR